MKKILITGGPVPANLDAVKIITNKFKGGRMVQLVKDFANTCGMDGNAKITYLTYKGSQTPDAKQYPDVTVIFHDGFDDYREKVTTMAKDFDAVILGAAVANLIPVNPWKGKFPSHDYNEGDIIPINFMIAPRIIDEVKKNAPNVKLFGFKLLSNVDDEELVRAAYETLTGSRADAVIANDATHLDDTIIVTKERGRHPTARDKVVHFVWDIINDQHYKTEFVEGAPLDESEIRQMEEMIQEMDKTDGFFPEVEHSMRFGCVAIRCGKGFITTARGKNEVKDFVRVLSVDHFKRVVYTVGDRKASLNSPLLGWIFDSNANISKIAHGHIQMKNIKTQQYAPPGTVRDSERGTNWSFNVEGHGCYLLIDEQGNQL